MSEHKEYVGAVDLSMRDYHAAPGVSNSKLMMIETRPSSVIWSMNAPCDPSKTGAADYGTALHTALLEPELFDESILIGPTKSRDTQAFQKFEQEHGRGGQIIILESEYDKIRLTVDSALADPTMSHYLRTLKFNREQSIFVPDNEHGLTRKIRVDADYAAHGHKFIGDVKTTANLDDWRTTARWKNPLFAHGYGHTAAYYLDTASKHYGVELEAYIFLVLSKSAELGAYPVDVIEITRSELEMYGFFDQVSENLAEYARRKRDNDWVQESYFPPFPIGDNDIK